MKRLYLVRHAAAELAPGQSDDHLFSVGNQGLGEKGRAQARALRDALAKPQVDGVFASPLRRAKETAEILAEPHGLPVAIDADLRELPFVPAGKRATYEEVMEGIAGCALALKRGEDACFPGGETWAGERTRFFGAVERAFEGRERILVVAHGGANRLYLVEALGMPPGNLFSLDQDHACVNVVAYKAWGPVAERVNYRPPR